MNIEPIGYVRSPISIATDENWGKVAAEIEVAEQYRAGLEGLNSFSHIVVIFFMHQASFDAASNLQRRPMGRAEMPLLGIFAQRSKHRPNPIGITAVKLQGVENGIIKVIGLDAIDGTPVLDIKPYFPVFDRVNDASIPDWCDILMKNYF